MTQMPDEDYDARNDFRDGIGIELDLSPEQEKQFAQCLAGYQGAYNAWSNNCTDPIESCLAEIGHDIGDSLTPTSMLLEILTGDIPKKPQTIWKDAANPAECGCAPWVK